jgi:hypothetical protein
VPDTGVQVCRPLITGCGRSGTHHVSQMLAVNGLDVLHERIGTQVRRRVMMVVMIKMMIKMMIKRMTKMMKQMWLGDHYHPQQYILLPPIPLSSSSPPLPNAGLGVVGVCRQLHRGAQDPHQVTWCYIQKPSI